MLKAKGAKKGRMKILIWTHHPGNVLGEAIDFATHGQAQHAAFLRRNGLIHEAYWPQLRDRLPMAAELPYVKVFTLRDLTPELAAAFEVQFDRALAAHIQYSVGDLFRFLFNAPNANEARTFCSRYVMHTIMEVCPAQLWPLVRCMEGDWVSPRDLFISPQLVPAEPLQLIS
jgi:hypothetical protein